MTKPICAVCGRRIKATEASLTVNTPASAEAVHVVCLRERAPASRAEKGKAAA